LFGTTGHQAGAAAGTAFAAGHAHAHEEQAFFPERRAAAVGICEVRIANPRSQVVFLA